VNDCGLAAVANAAGVPYREVKEVFGRLERGGMEFHELQWLLSRFGVWRHTRPRRPMTVAGWLPRHRQGRYVLLLDLIFRGHLIAAVDGVIHGEYADCWTVCDYFKLEVPNELHNLDRTTQNKKEHRPAI
jgi:hypothetical protein